MINSFNPIVSDSCEKLILGTMPGEESLRKQEYYGFGRNHFWKIIFTLFNKELSNNYKQKTELLLQNNIALWDVLKSCERETSSDSKIRNPIANDFNTLFTNYPNIKSIYFNGKTAEALFKRHVIKNINAERYKMTVLSSTSPANAIKFEVKLESWKQLLK